MARGTTKRQRYEATFMQASQILITGREVILRPESGEDLRTIMNYWYHWRKLYWGFASKATDTERARQAGVILDSKMAPDTDNNGRLCLRIRPTITPKAMVVEAASPLPSTVTAFSTGHGQSIPSADAATNAHWANHTQPWGNWFDTVTDMDGMLDALGLLGPTASIDDLPNPNTAEGAAMRARLHEYLRSVGKAKS